MCTFRSKDGQLVVDLNITTASNSTQSIAELLEQATLLMSHLKGYFLCYILKQSFNKCSFICVGPTDNSKRDYQVQDTFTLKYKKLAIVIWPPSQEIKWFWKWFNFQRSMYQSTLRCHANGIFYFNNIITKYLVEQSLQRTS